MLKHVILTVYITQISVDSKETQWNCYHYEKAHEMKGHIEMLQQPKWRCIMKKLRYITKNLPAMNLD